MFFEKKELYFIMILVIVLAILSYFYVDKYVAYFFHENIDHLLRHYIKMFSKLGESQYYLIPSAILFFIYKNKNKFIQKASMLIFLSVAMSGIIVDFIKVIVARYRPPMLFNEHLYGFKGFDIGFLVNSFPSGHSATAFSIGVAFMMLFPKYKYLFLLLSIMIALSRVLLAVHYLSDIMIGSLIGTLSSIYIYNKIFKDENEYQN